MAAMDDFLEPASFERFASDPLAALLPLGGGLIRIPAGGTFIHQGLPVDSLYCLLAGKAKIEADELNGRSLLVCFCQAPAFLGDVEVFRPDALASCTATAVDALTLWRIDRDSLRRQLGDNPWLFALLARSLADRLAASTRTSARNLLQPLGVRYADYLREAGPEGGWMPIRLEESAGRLGVSTRQLQRVIQALVRSGLAERRGRLLRLAGLRVQAGTGLPGG
jgi:CRP-like cAMP-binding protein